MMFQRALHLSLMCLYLSAYPTPAVSDREINGIASDGNFILAEQAVDLSSAGYRSSVGITSDVPVTVQRYSDNRFLMGRQPVPENMVKVLVTSNCDTDQTQVVPDIIVSSTGSDITVTLDVDEGDADAMPFLEPSSYSAFWTWITDRGGFVPTSVSPFDGDEDLTTVDACPEGQCRDPGGRCADEVNCFANPCLTETCDCTANYCGGCHAICAGVEKIDSCSQGQCLDPDGGCVAKMLCGQDPCTAAGVCGEGEVCTANSCTGCRAQCTGVPVFIEIPPVATPGDTLPQFNVIPNTVTKESCDKGGLCVEEGSTCARGTETCCGETYDSFRCTCENSLLTGRLEYGFCMYMESCMMPPCCRPGFPADQPPPAPGTCAPGSLCNTGVEDDYCCVDMQGAGTYCSKSGGSSTASRICGPDDAPCEAGEFCQLDNELDTGACNGQGVCITMTECTAENDPVCGCDGRTTYLNACFAHSAGTSVSRRGVCEIAVNAPSDPVRPSTTSAATSDPSDTSIITVVESSCGLSETCDEEGSTCATGTETCCGETHNSMECRCYDNGDGLLQYSCFYTDACLWPSCCRPDPPGDKPPPAPSSCDIGELCDSDIDDDYCCFDELGGGGTYCSKSGWSTILPTDVTPGECECEVTVHQATTILISSGKVASSPTTYTEATCGAMEFCQVGTGVCNGESGVQCGTCTTIPELCDEEYYDPVCGCDENTYSNACFAQSAGTSVSSIGGECEVTAPTSGGPAFTQDLTDTDGIVKQPSCEPFETCYEVGTSCATGTETCCGEAHNAMECECAENGDGLLQYSCTIMDACMLPSCCMPGPPEDKPPPSDGTCSIGELCDTGIDDDYCCHDFTGVADSYCSKSGWSTSDTTSTTLATAESVDTELTSPTLTLPQTPSPTEMTTREATEMPSNSPTEALTSSPTRSPTKEATETPSKSPIVASTLSPTGSPRKGATEMPSKSPIEASTSSPTRSPTKEATETPSKSPIVTSTLNPTGSPNTEATEMPSKSPIEASTSSPTGSPNKEATEMPSKNPIGTSTLRPTGSPNKEATATVATTVTSTITTASTSPEGTTTSVSTTDASTTGTTTVSTQTTATTFSFDVDFPTTEAPTTKPSINNAPTPSPNAWWQNLETPERAIGDNSAFNHSRSFSFCVATAFVALFVLSTIFPDVGRNNNLWGYGRFAVAAVAVSSLYSKTPPVSKGSNIGKSIRKRPKFSPARNEQALETCTYNVEVLIDGCTHPLEISAPSGRVVGVVIGDIDSTQSQDDSYVTNNMANLYFPVTNEMIVLDIEDNVIVDTLDQSDFQCARAVMGRPFVDATGGSLHAMPWVPDDEVESAISALSWTGEALMETLASPINNATARGQVLLGEEWIQRALGEHSSIASFSAFSIALMSNGAPAGLVSDALKAGLDEVRHARTSFDIASKLNGREIGPGPLPKSKFEFGHDLKALALAVAREGCVDETLSTFAAAVEVEHITEVLDKAVQDTPYANIDRDLLAFIRKELVTIAMDESNHSALAWRTLNWVCSVDSNVCDAVHMDVFGESNLEMRFNQHADSSFGESFLVLHSMREEWKKIFNAHQLAKRVLEDKSDIESICNDDGIVNVGDENSGQPLLTTVIENIIRQVWCS